MKEKITSILFVSFLVIFLITGIILPDKDISIEERRKLSSFPDISIKYVLDGTFFKKFNTYLVEQFPLRTELRNLKGFISSKILNKQENNGVFIKDDVIYQLNDNIDYKSIKHFTSLLQKIQKNYIKNSNVYYSVIPDKNYYLEDNSIPKLDYNNIIYELKSNLKNMSYIDIFDSLNIDSYYKTDIHWKQENLEEVLKQLQNHMNLEYYEFPKEQKTYREFYGALYGQIANNFNPDTITYITNNTIKNSKVYNYEKDKYVSVYEQDNLKNIDSYDVFLDGATPILIIENNNYEEKKELVIFRDSFGSSLVPLLIPNYSKLTVVDLRYLKSDFIKNIDLIDFNNYHDVLFLYSIPIINNSYTLN